MKNIIKYLAGAVIAVALTLGLCSLVSQKAHAIMNPVVSTGVSHYIASTGTFVCNGASNVTVTDANIAVGSQVLVTLNTVGGTVGQIPHVTTITAGVSFTTAGTASDTSTYTYWILN
jgi:hypothetical protein